MSSLASILLVESDKILSQQLMAILHEMSTVITQCFTIAEAFLVIDLTKYDLVIVSREMSDGDGIEVAEYLNETALSTKILVVSKQKISLQEKILAYQAGASDFLSKPIELLEFKYKISALLQLQKVMPNKLLQYGSIKLNPTTGTLYLGDEMQTHLRKKESAILTCLLRHRPKIVTKSMIIDYVWGESKNIPTHSTVDVYIRRLRTHMGHSHHLIKTARGYGYYLAE
jgi:two-component system OmpR family response regulator